MPWNPYEYQVFIAVEVAQRQNFINWVEGNPNRLAHLGFEDVVGAEIVKITDVPPPNAGEVTTHLGGACWVTLEQKLYWEDLASHLPPPWATRIQYTVHLGVGVFRGWLAGLAPPLYVLDEA